jgi:hypothetical protein
MYLQKMISKNFLQIIIFVGIIKSRVVDPYSFFTDPDPDPDLDAGGQYGSTLFHCK